MSSHKKSLKPSEASEYLGVSSSWLAKLRLYGGGPRYSKLGRSIRYATDELDAWLTRNLRGSTSEDGGKPLPPVRTQNQTHPGMNVARR
jgi:predicted DNA-binding transcriptional regulator AlpA